MLHLTQREWHWADTKLSKNITKIDELNEVYNISIQCDIVNIGNFFPTNSRCFFVSFAVLMWVLRNMSQRLSTTLFVDDLEPEVTKASAPMVCSNLGSDDGWLLTTANHILPGPHISRNIL